METVVSIICDKFKLKRLSASMIVFVFSALLGLISCFDYSIWSEFEIIGMQMLDFFDFITNSVIMLVTALLTCLFIGYIIGTKPIVEEVEITGKFKKKAIFEIIIKYVAPVCIVLILVSSILSAFGIITI